MLFIYVVSVLLGSLNLVFFSGAEFQFACIIEPFLFQFCSPFEYQKPIVGLS